MKRVLKIIGLAVLVLVLAGVVFKVTDLAANTASKEDTSRSDAELRADFRADLQAQQNAVRLLEAQLRSVGEKPVVSGPTTAQDLNDAPIVLIPGPRGPGPTLATVLNAVSQSIAPALRDNCGGTCNGADGDSVKGDPGESIKGDQGAPGSDGSDGTNGKDAPVISSSSCNDADEIVLNLSDGASITVTGSDCRVDQVLPPPDPEPTE